VSGGALKEGSIFAGDYKIIRPLRSGGQGSLYVVEQLSTSKQRALKLMLPELVALPASRKRFELEAKIAARIQSDHIVESIASGVDAKSGVPWLAMELLEGEDLSVHIQKKRHLPVAEVLEIFDQLCHALGEAHKQGIVHRDLKPENIFLSASRRRGLAFMVKVLDFGIARVMAEAKTQSGATVTGLGTPMWMAPEQTIPGGRVEPSTDVWPLGLLAFRLLTGYLFWKAPYDPGASVLMLMAEAFMHPLPTASKRAADYKCEERIPPGFNEWFAKCVARNMDDRYPDAAAAFTALEPILVAAVAAAKEGATPAPRASSAAITPEPALANTTGGTPVVREAVAAAPAGSTRTGSLHTGPGRGTWEGAPELAPAAVLSAEQSQPVSWPEASAPSTTQTPSADHVPPVQTTAVPVAAAPARLRGTTMVIGGACLAGVLVGAAFFAWSRSHAPPAASAGGVGLGGAASATARVEPTAPTPTVAATAPTTAPIVETAAPVDTAPADATAAASSSASASSPGGRRTQKLCKATGQKCFANDDCCDRVCRQWTCRPNEALRDPYGTGDKK
jgi:tRNA A-37 threonylcarbamoyl transferase component Bud32